MNPSNNVANPTKTLKRLRRYFGKYLNGNIFQGEALDFLYSLEKESAGIVFLDPPFNLGKVYTKKNKKLDNRPEAAYKEWFLKVLDEILRILAPGGALYLYHIPKWGIRFGSYIERSLDMRHWIAISMKNGFARGNRLYPAHYALLYFTKGEPSKFTRPKIAPSNCRHCGETIKDYGGYKKIIDEKGLNLSDFWEDLSPVRHLKHKYRQANELPPKILERVIEISGAKGMLFVDPFAGSGTGVLEAVKKGMSFAACDIVESNGLLICERLNEYRSRLYGRRRK